MKSPGQLQRHRGPWYYGGLLAVLMALSLRPVLAEPTDEEKMELQTAAQSYKDGAFDLCADKISALLKKNPKTELLPQAELLEAQALYQLGRSHDALAVFTLPLAQVPEDVRSDTLFWQGEALLDLGRWPEAESTYRTLLALKNAPARTNEATLGLAWTLFKEGKESEARPMIEALSKATPTGPATQQAQLLLAQIAISRREYPAAITALETLLGTQPEMALSYRANYWLGEADSANGEYAQAAAAYKKITGDLPADAPNAVKVQAFPKSLVAQAFLGLGRAEHQLHEDDIATLAYEQAYPLIENPADQMAAFRAYLEDARTARQLPDAVARLQEFAQTSDSAPAALLAIGSVLAEDGQDDKAIGILESLQVAYSKSSWMPEVSYQLGLLYAHTGKPDQAVRALQACLADNPDPSLSRQARFQLGYVLLTQSKDDAGAAAQFTQLSAGNDALAEDASFNLLMADAALGKKDVFSKAEADFEKRFPKSFYQKKIALAQGLLLAQAGEPEDAIAAYQKAASKAGGGPDQEALLKALSDLQYQTGDLAGTVATCQMIMEQFPNDSLIAAQRQILVSYEMKKLTDDQTEQALLGLAQKYDKSSDAAEAYFRLGEFYFYRQDYVKAQDAFQQLTTAYPSSPYAASAYFFAGRAAVAHNDYSSALGLLEKVPDDSPFKPDALLWEGRVYQQQLNFAQACTQADAMLATEKTGSRFVAANLLKGECLFEMGTKNPGTYPQALDAFAQILKSKEGTVVERNEAAVREAKTLEKMGRNDDAMELYLDVLYGRVAGNDGATVPGDFSWQIKAGWEASRIREAHQDWRGAIEIYKRLEEIGGPHQEEFHDLQNKLRRDNYIYE